MPHIKKKRQSEVNISKMNNNLNKLFLFLNNEIVQSKLKKFNLLISIISFVYIYKCSGNWSLQ